MRRPATGLAVVFVWVVVAGCGGDDPLTKAEYEQRVRAVYADVQEAFQATRVSPAQLAPRVADAQDALREAADRLDGVAPGEVAEENELLVKGMRDYAEDLDELREAAEEGDAAAIASFGERQASNTAVEEMKQAAEAMKGKRYDLGAIAQE